jgi:hypothetical protein
MKSGIIDSLIIYFLLFVTCILILLQSPIAPFAGGIPDIDSSVFIYSGKSILSGNLIYRDIFDHKGPFLYVIQVVGLKLFKGNLSSIWILELFSLMATSLILYKTIRLLYSRIVSLFSALSALIYIVDKLKGGNLSEEWALPYISIAVYLFVFYFLKRKKFTVIQLFILSLSFLLVFFLRPNMVAVWGGIGVIIIYDLLKNKRIKDLLRYILIIFLSIILGFLPFVIYGYNKNILHDAFVCIFQFNSSSYMQQYVLPIIKGFFYEIMALKYLPFIAVIYIVYTIFSYKEHFNFSIHIGVSLSIIFTAFACSIGNGYEHYYIIYLPLLVFPYAFIINYLTINLKQNQYWFTLVLFIIIFYPTFQTIKGRIKERYVLYKNERIVLTNNLNLICESEKIDKNDKILVIGNSCFYYLCSERFSSSSYPYIYPIINSNNDIIIKYLSELKQYPPKLIITDKFYNDNMLNSVVKEKLQNYIENNYTQLNTTIMVKWYGEANIWVLKK